MDNKFYIVQEMAAIKYQLLKINIKEKTPLVIDRELN